MSDHQKENALRIAAYLENRLSPEEREAFKRNLSEDDGLRLQYVDALMNRAATGQDARGLAEPAAGAEDTGGVDETLAGEEEIVREAGAGEREEAKEVREEVAEEPETEGMHGNWESLGEQGAREAWEAGWSAGRERERVGFFGSRWMVGVAVLLLVVAGWGIFILVRQEGYWNNAVAATALDSGRADKGNGVDSPAVKADSGRVAAAGNGGAAGGTGAAVGGGKPGLADSLYTRLYRPYMRGDDPVDVREYYQDYRTGRYAAVLAAGDSMVMKIPVRKLLVRDYMRLYLGLSYLASGDGQNAVRELEGVVLRTKPKDILYETARWYLALAWLKRNDVDAGEAENKALDLAREISHSYSRYQEPARELIKALGS
jgi:hypothetical protein